MIFLTVGTQEPFDRLVEAVDRWATSRNCGGLLFGQITDRPGYHPTSFESTDYLEPESFRTLCSEADLIISHAGMGTIITSMMLRKRLVMMPRRERLGEQRNDHQWATARKFRGRPGIHVAMSEGELPTLLDDVIGKDAHEPGAELSAFADQQLISSIRSFIHSQ